jgi:oligoribonuclease
MITKFLAIDLETTGLKPAEGVILEACAIPLSEDLQETGPRFNEVFGYKGVKAELSEFILKMHGPEGTGLLDARPTSTLGEFEAWLKLHTNAKIHLLGGSVNFDKNWLEHHFPNIRFSHQVLDTTSLKLLYPIQVVEDTAEHRAEADIEYSIRLAKAYRRMMKLALG